jgi:hypothetical protein
LIPSGKIERSRLVIPGGGEATRLARAEDTLSFTTPSGEPIAPPELPSADLLAVVIRATESLVAELEQARVLSGDWSAPGLTEALVETALSRCLATLAATGCWGPTNRLPSGELWRIAGSWLETGWLQSRARFKPRGYAGDYQLLHRICREELCGHPLGAAFDRYFQRQAAPQAVRDRTRLVAHSLVDEYLRRPGEAFRVVSVGSGAADDVYQAVAAMALPQRAKLQVVLLDMDPEALEFAGGRLGLLLPPGAVTCARENLSRLATRPTAGNWLAGADFLVCSGLFDYLDDAAAVAMLHAFWRRLVAGGRMLIGNFAPHNPTRAYMEWIGNWYLTYRTAEQLSALALAAEIPADRFSVISDTSGVDLFLTAK